ncbi:MAG: MFS transporter [alpha proteobacterium MED-G10]|nr:MAG: MFS transporter [alpha proteobacterium MED-G10]
MYQNFFRLYFNKKQFLIFLMGITSGIPLYLILSTLFIWLTREDIDISTIGLFALTQIPWSIKFLWAPIIDSFRIPLLHRLLGQRKAWLFIIQINLILFIILLGYSNPTENLKLTALLALIISFFSASQDVVIDAYRIEILNDDSQGAGAAMTQFGYRVGGLFAGAGSLYLTVIFSWEYVFLTISIIFFFLMVFIIFIIPSTNSHIASKKNLIEPFREFLFRNSISKVSLIFLFIFFFKFGDVIAGVMANPFYVKIGFSNIEIANASKVFGVIMTILGVFIGGYFVKIFGILKSLLISGFFQVFSNLLYVLLNYMGPELSYLFLTVAGENFSGGLGSAAFVAYLSSLCNRKYTGTQYALLSSIMGLARAILSSPSGYLVEYIGWSKFFIISTFLGLPSIIILFWMFKMFPLKDQKSMR